MGEEVDCLRVRQIKSADLEIIKTITINQTEELKAIALNIGFDINIVCNAYKINDISQLDFKNFEKVKKGLIDKGIKKEEVKNANN
jgi:outer membrane protein W